MARQTKFTPETEQRILTALRLGATRVLAAQAGGIHYDTLRAWIHSKPAFSVAVMGAESQAAINALGSIQKAAREGDWHAAAWMLERRYPDQYGRRNAAPTAIAVAADARLRIEWAHDWRGLGGVDSVTASSDQGVSSVDAAVSPVVAAGPQEQSQAMRAATGDPVLLAISEAIRPATATATSATAPMTADAVTPPVSALAATPPAPPMDAQRPTFPRPDNAPELAVARPTRGGPWELFADAPTRQIGR